MTESSRVSCHAAKSFRSRAARRRESTKIPGRMSNGAATIHKFRFSCGFMLCSSHQQVENFIEFINDLLRMLCALAKAHVSSN